MAINSIEKGKRSERAFAHWLRSNLQIESRRGMQYKGGSDSPDVISDLPLHFEVKAVENLNIYNAVKQAVEDCDEFFCVPVVAHKKKNKEWLMTIRAKDFKKLCTAYTRRVKDDQSS